MSVTLPISTNATRYGYIYWYHTHDRELAELLADRTTIDVIFDGTPLGTKRIDWKHRRISIGKKRMNSVGEQADRFILELYPDGRLDIKAL